MHHMKTLRGGARETNDYYFFFGLRPKKINHKFLGHRLIAFSYAVFVILCSELKKKP